MKPIAWREIAYVVGILSLLISSFALYRWFWIRWPNGTFWTVESLCGLSLIYCLGKFIECNLNEAQ